MLSRRGLRIKAMQILYMHTQNGGMHITAAEKQLRQSITNSFHAYLYILHFITLLAHKVSQAADIKANKYLPTEEDKKFSTKFYSNAFVNFLVDNHYFQSKLRREKLLTLVDDDMVQMIYTQLKEFEPYKQYILTDSTDFKKDVLIVKQIFSDFLCSNEYFFEHIENIISTWADDEFIVKGMMDELFLAAPFSEEKNADFFDFTITPDEETFSAILLGKTISENDHYDTVIEPALQNWELDRVSIIDKILLKMAITEFLYCPTIPPKVTLNEYLDISKLYSTPRSKEFINGVLDNVMSELKSTGAIVKTGRGLID